MEEHHQAAVTLFQYPSLPHELEAKSCKIYRCPRFQPNKGFRFPPPQSLPLKRPYQLHKTSYAKFSGQWRSFPLHSQLTFQDLLFHETSEKFVPYFYELQALLYAKATHGQPV